jgi:hypothetical protein
MLRDGDTQQSLFEDFKSLLEADTVDGDEKLSRILEMLDAIIQAPLQAIH